MPPRNSESHRALRERSLNPVKNKSGSQILYLISSLFMINSASFFSWLSNSCFVERTFSQLFKELRERFLSFSEPSENVLVDSSILFPSLFVYWNITQYCRIFFMKIQQNNTILLRRANCSKVRAPTDRNTAGARILLHK